MKKIHKLLSVLLVLCMVLAMAPSPVFATEEVPAEVAIGLESNQFKTNELTQFTVTTTGNSQEGQLVLGSYEFSDPSAVKSLEYLESKDGNWYPLSGDFGPATGFPLTTGATSTFRVSFQKAGTFRVTVSMKLAETGEVVCSTTETVKVYSAEPATVSHTLPAKVTVGEATQFTVTTTANGDAGTLVRGAFTFSDPEAIESLEYLESKDGNWYPLNGEFGPEGGFPVIDGTSTFRVTFQKAGTYDVNILLNAQGGDDRVICQTGTFRVNAVNVYDVALNLNAEEGSADKTAARVEEGQRVTFQVEAAEGYWIDTVTGATDYEIEDKTKATITVTPTKDTTVAVTFVKVYTMSIRYNGDGTVEVDGESVTAEGKVDTLVVGTQVKIQATPTNGFRVDSVVINGQETTFVDNDQTYTNTLTVDKDYEVQISFAHNIYNVSAVVTGEGTASLSATQVAFEGDATVTLESLDGHELESLTVNGEAVESVVTVTDTKATYTIKNITEDKAIEATFIAVETADKTVAQLSNIGDKVNQQGNLFVFKKNAKVTFSTDKDDIRIFLVGEDAPLTTENKSIIFTETTEIERVELRYQAEGCLQTRWHAVEESNVTLVIDDVAPTATIEVPDANKNGYYKSSVTLKATVADPDNYAPIAYVTYEVKTDVEENGAKVTKLLDGGVCQLNDENVYEIIVDGEKCNHDGVYLELTVADVACNIATYTSATMNINSTAPVLKSVVAQKNKPLPEAEPGHYYNDRVFEVTIEDRATTFDAEAVDFQFAVTNNTAAYVEPKVEWASNGDTHVATVTFSSDANYTWSFSYTNKAGLDLNKEKAAVLAADTYSFTVDKTAPFGSIQYKENSFWYKLLDILTFGLFDNKEMEVVAIANDATSETKPVVYYVHEGDEEILDEIALEKLYADGAFAQTNNVVNKDQRYVVYARLLDATGNVFYLSTEGMIHDTKKSEITVEPAVKATEEKAWYYTENVPFVVTVNDFEDGSGIKTIDYQVICTPVGSDTGVVKQQGNLYTSDKTVFTKDEIRETWSTADIDAVKLVVDAAANNYDHVVVKIIAVDFAGNESTKESAPIKIDVSAPEITVSYDNNKPDSEFYYNAPRKATIQIKDRHFDEKLVVLTAVNNDGEKPLIGKWEKLEAKDTDKDNGDDTTHQLTITFEEDGDYEFNIAYTDVAGWPNKPVDYGTSTTPNAFTIDQTAPEVTITYDNNSAANGKYFKAVRTATVKVVEHNFPVDEEGRVISSRMGFQITADRGGVAPTISWSHSGDVHTATIRYTKDGDYTFTMDKKLDLAGNEAAKVNYAGSVAAEDFVIDTTFKDMITIEGVESGKAYGYEATVKPSIRIHDINLHEYKVTLTGVQKDKTTDLTEQVNRLLNKGTETVTGIFDIFEQKQDLDGIYTLAVTSKDKADNSDSEQVVFTVNRYGSVYVYDDYLMQLIKDGGAYVQKVSGDLIITEYNADKLTEAKVTITRDGKPLENVQCNVTPEVNAYVTVGSSGWYQYKHTISAENFTTDGIYKVTLSSADATGNAPQNTNYEDMGISFQVDSTKAEITSITGLEDNIINAESVTVKYVVYDTMGIKSIQIIVNGTLLEEITDFSADYNNYTGQFVLLESKSAQKVQIVVTDLAGNVTDTANEFTSAYTFYDEVTVSTNIFVRWYADKALFWGSIGGAVVLLGGIWLAIALILKKKQGN